MHALSARQRPEIFERMERCKNNVASLSRLKHSNFLIASMLLLLALNSATSIAACDPTILFGTTNMLVQETQMLRIKSGQANWNVSQYPQPADPNNPTVGEYLAMTQGDGRRGKLTNPDGSPITGKTSQVMYTASSDPTGVCADREAAIVASCESSGSVTMNVSTTQGTAGVFSDYHVQQKPLQIDSRIDVYIDHLALAGKGGMCFLGAIRINRCLTTRFGITLWLPNRGD